MAATTIPTVLVEKLAGALNDCSHMSTEFADLYHTMRAMFAPEDAHLLDYTKSCIEGSSGLAITKEELDDDLDAYWAAKETIPEPPPTDLVSISFVESYLRHLKQIGVIQFAQSPQQLLAPLRINFK
jgi:hypothetical protein